MMSPTRWTPRLVLCAIVIGTLLLPFPSRAQQQNPAPADTASQGQSKPAEKSGSNDDPAIELQKKPENDRIFWALPNYLTVKDSKQIPPLTTGQKFKLVALGTFDPVEFPYVAVIAGIDQGENDDPSYGQGFKGFAKRYAVAYADTTVENFMVGAVLPSLLRQDPRYFQLGKGGFWHRAGYAALRIFITRTDSGKNQFNYSELVGSAAAAGISVTYHPEHDRTVSNAANIWVTQLWGDALGFEVKEFWPDIKRKLLKK